MNKATELSLKSSDKKIIVAAGVLIGTGVGFAIPYVWKLIERFDELPFHQILSFLMSFQSDWVSIARPVLFAVVGLLLAGLLVATLPRVLVSDEKIEICKGENRRIIKRSKVASIYFSGSKLIIESEQGRRLFNDSIEGGKEQIATTFKKHGYPWEA